MAVEPSPRLLTPHEDAALRIDDVSTPALPHSVWDLRPSTGVLERQAETDGQGERRMAECRS